MKFLRSLMLASLVACTGVLLAQTALPPKPSAAKPSTPQAPIPPAPQPTATSWVLMDYATGQILASHDMNAHLAPASLTKVMTAYVVGAELKSGKIHMNDKVYITKYAWEHGGASTDGSTSFLKLHSRVPLKDLLYGMLVQSGNDAAIALAQHVAGTEAAFAGMMNAYAQRLGMTGSHFVNASGYPAKDHYSTARDVAILSRALIHNFPRIYQIVKVKKFQWNGIMQYNRNPLLTSDPSVDGIKTGSTKEAGFCLAASALRHGRRLIAVTMGSPDMHAAASGDEALLNWGFHFSRTHKLYAAGQVLITPPLWKGRTDTLKLGIAKDAMVTIPRGEYSKLKASAEIPSLLIAPFKQGQRVGTLKVTYEGKPVLTRPLVATKAAPEGGFFKRLWDTILLWFHHDSGKTTASVPSPAPASAPADTAQ
jgi:D-alanyl-D-alanine carboxypeptidase (penicillin-binding protein 5/6)